MNVQEKLRLAHQLDRLGVDVIEAGFPIASDGDFAAVQAIAAAVRRPIIAALARASSQDIERAWQALKGAARPRIHIFLATSDIHLQYKLKISRQQCLEQARDAVRLAKTFVRRCGILSRRRDPHRSRVPVPGDRGRGGSRRHHFEYPRHSGLQHAGGIRRTDSRAFGIASGTEVVISAHCHNDLGLAVANSLAAVAAGARQVECTINGIGERAGNASLEEIVMAMRVRPDRYATRLEW